MAEGRLREAARFLVNSGCLIDLRENSGESPLHVACLRKERLLFFFSVDKIFLLNSGKELYCSLSVSRKLFSQYIKSIVEREHIKYKFYVMK